VCILRAGDQSPDCAATKYQGTDVPRSPQFCRAKYNYRMREHVTHADGVVSNKSVPTAGGVSHDNAGSLFGRTSDTITKLLPTDDLNSHVIDLFLHSRIGENSCVVTPQKMAGSNALQFMIVIAAVNDHLSHTGLQITERIQIPCLAGIVIFAFIELEKIINRRQFFGFQDLNILGTLP
jgi:hypothetical protein